MRPLTWPAVLVAWAVLIVPCVATYDAMSPRVDSETKNAMTATQCHEVLRVERAGATQCREMLRLEKAAATRERRMATVERKTQALIRSHQQQPPAMDAFRRLVAPYGPAGEAPKAATQLNDANGRLPDQMQEGAGIRLSDAAGSSHGQAIILLQEALRLVSAQKKQVKKLEQKVKTLEQKVANPSAFLKQKKKGTGKGRKSKPKQI